MQVRRGLRAPGRYSDGGGLMLHVRASGTRSWVLRMQHSGRRRDFGIGSADDVSLTGARERAGEIRKAILAGRDPALDRQAKGPAVLSFREAALLVHSELCSTWDNPKHRAQWLSTLERYAFPLLGELTVDKIEGPVLRNTLMTIWLEKPETARRVRQRIGVVLDWAYAMGHRATEAPLRSITRGLPKQPAQDTHFEAMPFTEVPAFIRGLRSKTASISRLALEFTILTAARSGNTREAIWDEFTIEGNLPTWRIPGYKMKGRKRPHSVPLPSRAVEILKTVSDARVGDYVFPGRAGRLMSDMTLLQLLRREGLSFDVHGFRSSFRDWVSERTSYPRELAELSLAHAYAGKSEAAYARSDLLEKRRPLMTDWAAFCESL